MKRCMCLALSGLLLYVVGCTAAPIYTWQDERGQVYFSDQPLSNNGQSRQMGITTQIPLVPLTESQQQINERYSIRRQMEYFDQRRESQRQAWLERRRLIQSDRQLQQQAQQIEQQASRDTQLLQVVVVNPQSYYSPYQHYSGYQQPTGIQVNNPYALQLQHAGDHHQFNLNVGNPHPSYPLNFWKY